MGLMQNHNTITGTAKSHVTSDFVKILHQSITNGKRMASESMKKWASRDNTSHVPEFHSCLLLNISSCNYSSDSKTFIVTVYNPTAQLLTTFVRIPVQNFFHSVSDFAGNDMVTQMVPIPKQVKTIPGRVSSATMELVFLAENISPLGFQSFHVKRKNPIAKEPSNGPHPSINSLNVQTEFYHLSVDTQGRVHVYYTKGARDLHIKQYYNYYEGFEGSNAVAYQQSSGTHIFRPKQENSREVEKNITYQIYKGDLVEEIHLAINDWISQVIRMYDSKDIIEFDWLIGPIPVNDNVGKEIVSIFASNIQNNGKFYTDSNGREMIKRKLYKRPHYKLSLVEKVAGNYYPVTTKISIEDKRQMLRMSVMNDRSQGGSSLMPGKIELMVVVLIVQRRLLSDDGVGLDEPLNETAFGTGVVIKGKHTLVVGSLAEKDELVLREKVEFTSQPWIFFTPTSRTFHEWSQWFE
ncbi:lysosomal alpha-mannosidase-like [Copidosoma floridanum]|uniref:lysosomal alpha-mannosidase-like n=1 Tax=Copidosoma floridanum TaxID=29053 RepID=UPI0006C98752|nr:lysosomal alpha-mannosidase-like [Copidosoma floridanum]